MKFSLFGLRKKKNNNKKSFCVHFPNNSDDELSDIEYIKNLIEEEREKKEKYMKEYNIYKAKHMQIFDSISISDYSPLQSIILNDPINMLFDHSNNKRPLKREEILHNYITGEDNRKLLDSPTIATELENSKSSNIFSDDHFCSRFDSSVSKQNEEFKSFNDKQKEQTQDVYLENIFSDKNCENEYNNDKQSLLVLNRNNSNKIITENELPSSIMCDSKLDLLTDLESFVSNDQWTFQHKSVKKFKYLCLRSNHCWEENGKLPNIK